MGTGDAVLRRLVVSVIIAKIYLKYKLHNFAGDMRVDYFIITFLLSHKSAGGNETLHFKI